jgi:hypothetical protein
MMQPCASAAMLRGSGTILWNGESQVPPRSTATSDYYRVSPNRWRTPDNISIYSVVFPSSRRMQSNAVRDFTGRRIAP